MKFSVEESHTENGLCIVAKRQVAKSVNPSGKKFPIWIFYPKFDDFAELDETNLW